MPSNSVLKSSSLRRQGYSSVIRSFCFTRRESVHRQLCLSRKTTVASVLRSSSKYLMVYVKYSHFFFSSFLLAFDSHQITFIEQPERSSFVSRRKNEAEIKCEQATVSPSLSLSLCSGKKKIKLSFPPMEAVLFRQTGNVSVIHSIYLTREKKRVFNEKSATAPRKLNHSGNLNQ